MGWRQSTTHVRVMVRPLDVAQLAILLASAQLASAITVTGEAALATRGVSTAEPGWERPRRRRRREKEAAAPAEPIVPVVVEEEAEEESPRQLRRRLRREEGASSAHVYRQTMSNFEDVQYFSSISIGNQKLTGIIDTGSFELVVFPSQCTTCGRAAKYDPTKSAEHSAKADVVVQAYGSGQLMTVAAEDMVTIGHYPKRRQGFWEVTFAMMPILKEAAFEAIVGVGPPESAVNASRMPTMLEGMGISIFSVCLGKEPRSEGFFIWNDTSALERPNDFWQVQVLGGNSWTVKLSSAQLISSGIPIDIGCVGGNCAGLIDSGTSLLMLPTSAVDKLLDAVTKLNANCSNLDDMPHLAFKLDGKLFTLPPDSYIAEAVDDKGEKPTVPAEMMGFARIRSWQRPGYVCQLMVMEGNTRSQYGQTWILGMPFFRKYYTSFNLGGQGHERAMYVAPATSDCTPQTTDAQETISLAKERSIRRRIDLSKVLVPRLNNLTSIKI